MIWGVEWLSTRSPGYSSDVPIDCLMRLSWLLLHTPEHIHTLSTICSHLRKLAPISIKQDGVLACTAKAGIVEPCRLPVIDTLSKTMGNPTK